LATTSSSDSVGGDRVTMERSFCSSAASSAAYEVSSKLDSAQNSLIWKAISLPRSLA
jgi:hypothetical protein